VGRDVIDSSFVVSEASEESDVVDFNSAVANAV
jgi:hypothetical protein